LSALTGVAVEISVSRLAEPAMNRMFTKVTVVRKIAKASNLSNLCAS